MTRFLSNATNRVDAKGRVSVPAHFRQALASRDTSELYALRALEVPAMEVGGMDLLESYEKRIAQEDPFLGIGGDMSFYVHGDSVFLKLDKEGRITITDFVREHTQITDEVAFVGLGHFFQIWEPAALREHFAEVRSRLMEEKKAERAALATARTAGRTAT